MTIEKIRIEIEARIEKLECDHVNAWHTYKTNDEVHYRQMKISEEKAKLEKALEELK
jgi:hypothetical protein